MKHVLVTGGSGQVGTELRALGPKLGFEVLAPGRAELDLSSSCAIDRLLDREPLAAIINCAAYTAVDKAESEAELAFAVNAAAPGLIAKEAAARTIPLLHVSTDYVFDGARDDFYVEDDPVAPLGVYGASKLDGERAIEACHPAAVILRTAWVVSPHGHNFVKTMLRVGAERKRLRVVDDQRGSPTSARDIARTLLAIAGRGDARGTYHFVNSGEASWWDLARFVFDRAGLDVEVEPITTADYPTPARRPANSRLSTTKLQHELGITPRPWQEAVGEVVDELVRNDK